LLIVFKYTSNQSAIKRVRADIKAHLLALKLFKESATVALRAQGRILLGAFKLMVLAIVPMLVMLVPVSLLLEQLALWYQSRPLEVGEDAVVTVKLNGDGRSTWPAVRLEPSNALICTTGPVRIQSDRAICWNIRGRESGYHRLVFDVDAQPVEKELAIGSGYMRVSTRRPGWNWWDALRYPCEEPFGANSPVQSIEVEYPDRSSWTSGTDLWVIYWFIVSMVAALCFRRLIKVSV
jgi:hypothetical protein